MNLTAREVRTAVAGLLLAASLAACGTTSSVAGPDATSAPPVAEGTEKVDATPTAAPTPTASPTADASPTGPTLSDGELADLGVNEIGRVLVVEWHDIGDEDSRWDNALSTFRAQLQELYDRGYRPVSVEEFATGRFDIPAGTSPVLLTFDDSYRQHLHFAEDGSTPHPDSAVGILEQMEREDPDWRARAVFSFYWPYPFRDTDRDVIERKLRYLAENGYDLANHTYNHDNLAEMDDAEVQANLARSEVELAGVVGPDYDVRAMTLTQGIWPQNRELAVRGEADGFRYEHDVVFLVGFMPTRSPNHVEYDPMQVQRVQAYVPEFRKWVDWLDEEPGRRFISDGDPDTVTYPAAFADVADPLAGLEVRTYGAPAGD